MENHYFLVSPLKRQNIFFRFFSYYLKKMNITGWLISINLIFFIITLIAGAFGDLNCANTICNFLALQPSNLFLNNYWWTLLTSMFMHAGFFHLFVNMFSLYFIGNFLEMLIGKRRFFWAYLSSGIFAGLFFAFFAFLFDKSWFTSRIFGGSMTFAVGASGAIFAIAGVLAILTPRSKVYLILGPIIAIIIQEVLGLFIKSSGLFNTLNFFISIYVIFSLFVLISPSDSIRKIALPISMPFWLIPLVAIVPLFIIGLFAPLPIGNMAHLGGFIAGALYGIYLRVKYKKKTKLIAEYYSR